MRPGESSAGPKSAQARTPKRSPPQKTTWLATWNTGRSATSAGRISWKSGSPKRRVAASAPSTTSRRRLVTRSSSSAVRAMARARNHRRAAASRRRSAMTASTFSRRLHGLGQHLLQVLRGPLQRHHQRACRPGPVQRGVERRRIGRGEEPASRPVGLEPQRDQEGGGSALGEGHPPSPLHPGQHLQRAGAHQLAPVEDADAGAEPLGLGEEVGVDEQRRPPGELGGEQARGSPPAPADPRRRSARRAPAAPGSPTSAAARPSRWRIPLLKPRMRRPAASASPTRSSSVSSAGGVGAESP